MKAFKLSSISQTMESYIDHVQSSLRLTNANGSLNKI